jgi:multiple sugar transport system substrate-binding protein
VKKKWKMPRMGWVFILSLILIVSGCGTGNDNVSSSNRNNESVDTADQTTTTNQNSNAADSNKPEEEATIQFWYPGNTELISDAVEKLIVKFEQEHPNIKVEYTGIPWADYFQKLSVSYSGGLAPDVHGLGFGQLISTVDQDKYLNMNEFIERDNWDGVNDFYPDILGSGQWKGGQYGLLIPEMRGLLWRKDFFQEAGLDPEKPPQTIDELFEYAEKLKVIENGKTVRAGIDIPTSNGEQTYMSLILPQGGDVYDSDGNPTFDSEQSIQTVSKMAQLVQSGAVIPSNQLQIQGPPFQSSLSAMAFLPQTYIQTMSQTVDPKVIGMSLPPKSEDGKQTAMMLGTFVTIAKTTKHPDASWKFVKFMFDNDNLLEFTVSTGYVPGRKSLKDAFIQIDPINAITFEMMQDAQSYKPSATWNDQVKYLRIALEEVYYGKKSAEQALKDGAEQVRQQLKNN